MTAVTEMPAARALNSLLTWYAKNQEALNLLASQREVTIDELLPTILDEALAANGMALAFPKHEPGVIEVQDLRIDERARRVWKDGHELSTPRLAYELLALLARNAGQVVTRRMVAEEVWGDTYGTVTKTMDMHISWLRKVLGDDAKSGNCQYINTIRGVGWRLERG